MVDRGALLLDVREPDEWCVQRAPAAMLLPMGRVRARHNELPRHRRIVVVCRSGGRSAAVTAALRRSGFDAVNLAGGMCAWAAAGLPVVTGGGDPGLVVHREQPLNCETSIAALIGGVVMPNARFYVRNHFPTPTIDPELYELTVTGLVERPLSLRVRDLQNMPSQSLVATLECAGNGRALFDPPVDGEQWRFGAASTAEWTGVPLVEVLDRAGTDSRRPRRRVPRSRHRAGRRRNGAGAVRAQPVGGRCARLGRTRRLRDEGESLPLQHGLRSG